jgi:hypothetical protein
VAAAAGFADRLSRCSSRSSSRRAAWVRLRLASERVVGRAGGVLLMLTLPLPPSRPPQSAWRGAAIDFGRSLGSGGGASSRRR